MIIYRDAFTGDELFADSFKMKLVDDLYYEVEGMMITRTEGFDDALIGANPSAEEASEGLDSSSSSGIDIVLNHKLMEVQYDKKAYMSYVKKYMKKLADKVAEKDGADKAKELKEKMNNLFAKKIIPNIKNFQFFVGEQNFGDEEGMIALLDFREDGITPYFLFFKDGLEEEKF